MEKQKIKITVREVAARAGVSTATVSRAFNHKGIVNPKTYQSIMKAATALDYKQETAGDISPDRAPVISYTNRNNSKKAVDKRLLIINIPAISNPFYTEIIKGIQSSALNHQFDFLLYSGHIKESSIDTFLELVDYVKAQGVILLNLISEELLARITEIIPVVQCCEYTQNEFASSVGINDFTSTQRAMDYFLSTGRKRIGFINGPLSYKFSQNRLQAYYKAMETAGIEVQSQWVIQLPDLSPDMAFSSVVKLLSMPDAPDCFFAVSDVLAAAAIRAAHYCRLKVPGDILVIGFDNTDISHLTTPSITTVNQPKFQLGFLACELLCEKIRNPESEVKHMLLNTELILRESTAVGAFTAKGY